MSSDDEPAFGFGKGGRPLWTSRDRDAEAIRELLRRAGHREFGEGRGGFVVEPAGAGQGGTGPYPVTCTDLELVAAGELTRYAEVLQAAGWQVLQDLEDDQVLAVWPD